MNQPPATLLRKLASLCYEWLLLLALCFIAAFLFLALTQAVDRLWIGPLLQLWLTVVLGCYFVWFWTHGGQTLPMKTWHIALVTHDEKPLGVPLAVGRYLLLAGVCLLPNLLAGMTGPERWLLAAIGPLAFLLSACWALFDRDGQFLHDRLLGTRQINRRTPKAA